MEAQKSGQFFESQVPERLPRLSQRSRRLDMYRLTRDDIEQAARQVYQVMPATAQYAWPLLAERLGA